MGKEAHAAPSKKAKKDEEVVDDNEGATEVEREAYNEKTRWKGETEKKRKIKKKSKPVCKNDVRDFLQFLDEMLSIRAAEPEEQKVEVFTRGKCEKGKKTGMGRKELPCSPKLQEVMPTLPSSPTKTVLKGESNTVTVNIKRCLYDTDRYTTTVNNEKEWKGKQYFDRFAYEKFRQAGMVEAQAKEENSVQCNPRHRLRRIRGRKGVGGRPHKKPMP